MIFSYGGFCIFPQKGPPDCLVDLAPIAYLSQRYGFPSFSSVVSAFFCASVRPHSVIEIYMLVAPILSAATIARTIFCHSSCVWVRQSLFP